MGAVVGADVLVVALLTHKVGDEGQEFDHSGRLAQRTLTGRFQRPPTFACEI
jgi:hypothetical protein